MARTSSFQRPTWRSAAAFVLAAGLLAVGAQAMVPVYRPVITAERPIRPVAAEADGAGRLLCVAPGSNDVIVDMIGWVVGGSDTVVTEGSLALAGESGLDPRSCFFQRENADGSVRDLARIRRIHAPWRGGQRDDEEADYSVVKLDRAIGVQPVAFGGAPAPLAVAAGPALHR